MNKILEVKNLAKKYADVMAVDDVSFDVNAGEIVGLLGPNGAGKTTTISMLLGSRASCRYHTRCGLSLARLSILCIYLPPCST